jgi:hypothetical protein
MRVPGGKIAGTRIFHAPCCVGDEDGVEVTAILEMLTAQPDGAALVEDGAVHIWLTGHAVRFLAASGHGLDAARQARAIRLDRKDAQVARAGAKRHRRHHQQEQSASEDEWSDV